MDDIFNDRLARYSFMYRSRNSNNEKTRFLKALVTDISQVRKDISVIEYRNQKKDSARNVYVGDIEKADQIVCTYYDTPPAHLGDYVLFDRKKQEKQTTKASIYASLIWALLGILGTLLYMKLVSAPFVLFSVQTVCLALIYGGYFIILSKLSKGTWNRKNLIRNTSSILCLLQMLTENQKQKKVAYAFIDEGCYGERGLDVLISSVKKNAKVYYLDSIGADATLNVMGPQFKEELAESKKLRYVSPKDKINYLFSADMNQNNEFYLDKSKLNKKNLNYNHFTQAIELLNQNIKGD
ncbi:hypothetical protein [Clostridium sp. 'White wine YQ']|uniref:hypothetical protein n=1 Tax=Clostridium sp. 'White wine YQ' TaxID=3027474 RepID=UPI002365CA62|nr:hypothetical protein [Clostridium sp. 'White wine YQ']MDD7794848.1 hypothetical protein [Clostridium sp. 'White wine YQ']